MSSRRPPATPPDLPGFAYRSVLGSGGFSDVYLYEQDRPRRNVAVKVLVADLKTDGARRRFESEANLMAQLSSHPYIVTIYEANVTAAGHSYLAMEYCSRPSLDVRYRRARFSVDEVLGIGIQVASAVETAHRAGIAHRDIKPANILVTDYNRPALTDFGISGTMDAVADDDAGMSIPWSPPESFTSGAADGVKVDIWALGATLYTLLAGHSPFVIPGAENSQRELISRINTTPLPRLGRADVPEALDLVLATCMSKSPASRYSSAKALARALMRIQADLNLSVTPFEVQDDAVAEAPDPDAAFEATRVRRVVSIDPDATPSGRTFPSIFRTTEPDDGRTAAGKQGATGSFTQSPRINSVPGVTGATHGSTSGLTQNGVTVPSDAKAVSQPTVSQPTVPQPAGSQPGSLPNPADELLASTVHRSQVAPPPNAPALPGCPGPDSSAPASPAHGGPATPPSTKRKWLGLGAGAVLAAAVVVGIVLATSNGGTPSPEAKDTVVATPPPALIVGAEVPAVTKLAAKAGNGGAVWSWVNPDPKPGDMYLWAAVSAVDAGDFKPVKAATVFVINNPNDQSCISVKLVRKDGTTSAETKKCFP
ncbi:hypothetical protein AL755_06565 [Arthrobacter sp. ERGS1:01]|uniref:serine/threonine-protein kinase n=1 Tax=Arthrobacter sp. ERGS1:01 TaxID=1704044 RepID=UPI0006B50DF2|nr:serine/threonine-protein kinase [Arthrobacter sp. ERGS1:01]ALE05216.1 hypothetical protein AL755_06565 [Arthrobacter sp. ERGS1:01]